MHNLRPSGASLLHYSPGALAQRPQLSRVPFHPSVVCGCRVSMELSKHHAHVGLPRLTRSGVSSDKGMFLRPQGRLMQLGQEHWPSPVVLELECHIRISQEAWVSQLAGPHPSLSHAQVSQRCSCCGCGGRAQSHWLNTEEISVGCVNGRED